MPECRNRVRNKDGPDESIVLRHHLCMVLRRTVVCSAHQPPCGRVYPSAMLCIHPGGLHGSVCSSARAPTSVHRHLRFCCSCLMSVYACNHTSRQPFLCRRHLRVIHGTNAASHERDLRLGMTSLYRVCAGTAKQGPPDCQSCRPQCLFE